jgi:hypothetical protein
MGNTQNLSRQTEIPCLDATTSLRKQGQLSRIRDIYLLFATVTFQSGGQVQKENCRQNTTNLPISKSRT